MHVDHTSAVKKRNHQKFVGGFALSGLLGSGRASMLPLGTQSLGLWVIAVDPAFITGHFFQVLNSILFHIVLPHVQIAFLKFTNCDNQVSNCCCSCSFEPEIINISQSSHKMYSNNVQNFQESTTILNAFTKMSGKLLKSPRRFQQDLTLNNLQVLILP